MADRKISELAAATTVGSTDLTVLVQSGVTKKVPLSVLLDGNFVNQNSLPTATPTINDSLIAVQGNVNKLFSLTTIHSLLTEQISDSVNFSSLNKLVWVEGTTLKKYPMSSVLVGENIDNSALSQATIQESPKLLVLSGSTNKTLLLSDLVNSVPINHTDLVSHQSFNGTDKVLADVNGTIGKLTIQQILDVAPINHSTLAENTQVSTADTVLLVADNLVKKVSIDNFIGNLPYHPRVSSSELITATAFSIDESIYVSMFDSIDPLTGTLLAGNNQSKIQNKYLVNLGTQTVTVSTTGNNYTTITIQPNGLVRLVWINSAWWIESEVGATHG